ncbi:hypothetical protein [Streptomyces himalayensis]|uniref:Lipoprotein n=1 Tax=Streptomyces himalayensis subsp. himalayensis TaxID=2756131 RepID=A0A7W0DH14_9ACTN|nr:hypothetical protein [Streptomyces himalayensis]MBA2944877.1 hypothetical protein [Streptomyces himalayensis subsp. himalayensis]
MSFPLPSRARRTPDGPSRPRRRSVLAGAAVAGAGLLAGCSGGGSGSGSVGTPARRPSAVELARARAASDSAGLVARYDAVIAAHPALAERVGALREEVVRHVEAFGGEVAAAGASGAASGSGAAASAAPSAAPSAPAAPSASGSASASAGGSGGFDVPSDKKGALAFLASAERSLADRRGAALLEVPGELARLLASVAAAGAAHAYLLTEGD